MKRLKIIALTLTLSLAAPQAMAMENTEMKKEDHQQQTTPDKKTNVAQFDFQKLSITWPRGIRTRVVRENYLGISNKKSSPLHEPRNTRSWLFPELVLDTIARHHGDSFMDRNTALVCLKPDAKISFKKHVSNVARHGYTNTLDYFDFKQNSMLEKISKNDEKKETNEYVSLCNGKTFDTLTFDDKTALRNEAIWSLSQQFKLHLQIKPECLPAFMKKFADFIAHNTFGQLISQAKCPINDKAYDELVHHIHVAPVVAYPQLLPSAKMFRNRDLQMLLQTFVDRFRKYLEPQTPADDIALRDAQGKIIVPRYSRQIKGFLFLAQGDGDTKETVQRALNDPLINRFIDNPYTNDWAFFKGEEFDEEVK